MKKPIGCRAHHFYRQVGTENVCMYCGHIKFDWKKFKTNVFLIQQIQLKMEFQLQKFKESKLKIQH